MIRRLLLAALVPIALVGGLAFASGGGTAGEADRSVLVTMDEFTLASDHPTVPAGIVRFETRNDGAVDHELLVVRTDLAPDALPMGLEGPAVKLAGPIVLGKAHRHGESHADAGGALSRHVRPGGTLAESVELSPGRYVLLCSLPGHYAAGQRAALTVL